MRVQLLGQSGVKAWTRAGVLYVDPYLSDSVEKAEGPGAKRLRPAPFAPEQVSDAAFVAVTHEHLDHFDPDSLGPVASSSPKAVAFVPKHLVGRAAGLGFGPRAQAAPRNWLDLGQGARLTSVGASHPEPSYDADGNPWACAYVLEDAGQRFLFTGDTSLTEDLVSGLRRHAPYKAAFLPINERNHYREKAGIIGNMTLREVFGLMEEIKASVLVPQHWDMFAPNRVYPEELEVLKARVNPPFDVHWDPREV